METIGVKERELGKQYGQELEAEERLANQGERATSRGRRGGWGGGGRASQKVLAYLGELNLDRKNHRYEKMKMGQENLAPLTG